MHSITSVGRVGGTFSYVVLGGVALLVMGQAAAVSISFAGQVVSSIFPHCDSRGEVRDKPRGGRIDTSQLNGLPESAAVVR